MKIALHFRCGRHYTKKSEPNYGAAADFRGGSRSPNVAPAAVSGRFPVVLLRIVLYFKKCLNEKTMVISEYPKGRSPIRKKQLTVHCPYECNMPVGVTLVSIPDHNLVHAHGLNEVGAVYMCNGCKKPIYIRFRNAVESGDGVHAEEAFQVQRVKPLLKASNVKSEDVKRDIEEALDCYSVEAWNGFASVCRRAIQSVCEDHDVKGKAKVERQAKAFTENYDFDEEMKELLNQIILTGHDGAHPHLPLVSKERAEKLFAFMQEIIRQVYDLPSLLGESKKLRTEAVKAKDKGAIPALVA